MSRAAGSTFNRFAINSFADADEVLRAQTDAKSGASRDSRASGGGRGRRACGGGKAGRRCVASDWNFALLPLSGKENSPCLLRSRSEAVLGETASRGAPNVGEKLL